MAASPKVRILRIEHRTLRCSRPFELVHDALIAAVPALKPDLAGMLARGERAQVEAARRTLPKLWLFLARDHGSLTIVDSLTSQAIQYGSVNLLTAQRIARCRSGA